MPLLIKMSIIGANSQSLSFFKGSSLRFNAQTRLKILKDLTAFLDQSPGEILIKLKEAISFFFKILAGKSEGSLPLPFCTVIPVDLLAMHSKFEHLFDLFVLEPDLAIDILSEVIQTGVKQFPETQILHKNDIFVAVKLTSVPPLTENGNGLIAVRGVLAAQTLPSKYL